MGLRTILLWSWREKVLEFDSSTRATIVRILWPPLVFIYPFSMLPFFASTAFIHLWVWMPTFSSSSHSAAFQSYFLKVLHPSSTGSFRCLRKNLIDLHTSFSAPCERLFAGKECGSYSFIIVSQRCVDLKIEVRDRYGISLCVIRMFIIFSVPLSLKYV